MYPCKECLVKVVCSQFCNELEKNYIKVTLEVVGNNTCIDCGNEKLESSVVIKGSLKDFTCTKCWHFFIFDHVKGKIYIRKTIKGNKLERMYLKN